MIPKNRLSFAILFLIGSCLALNATIPYPCGVNVHFTNPNTQQEQVLDYMQLAGFKFVRTDLTWAIVEQQQGVYDFSYFDPLVSATYQRGMGVLYILDYGNPLYTGNNGADAPNDPTSVAAYSAFAAAAASRYMTNNVWFEIWNEPDTGSWQPSPNPGAYQTMATQACAAIRSANPNAVVMGPAIADMYNTGFLKSALGNQLAKCLTFVSVHGYHSPTPEDWAHQASAVLGIAQSFGFKGTVVNSEWGASTAGASPNSQDQQAAQLVRQWLSTFSFGAPISVWYDAIDDGSTNSNFENGFGLLDFNMDPKKSFFAAQYFTQQLNGLKFLKMLPVSCSIGALAVKFNGPTTYIVVWSAGAGTATASVSVDNPNSCWKVTDIVGTMISTSSCTDSSGNVNVPIEGAVQIYYMQQLS